MVQHYYGFEINYPRGCGLKFGIRGKRHFGWARLSVRIVNGKGILATLTGYAYETIPGKAIKAGQTKEAEEDPTNEDFNPGASLKLSIPDKPQPASLGMLALGTSHCGGGRSQAQHPKIISGGWPMSPTGKHGAGFC
jgi:hypothetical protein